MQDLRYFVPLPAGATEKGKESSVPGKLELLKVRSSSCLDRSMGRHRACKLSEQLSHRVRSGSYLQQSYATCCWLRLCRA